MRIAAIFRGGGPQGAEKQAPLPWASFDQHLLKLATQKGARRLRRRVTALSWDGGRPRLELGESEGVTYDFLIGAVGLNGSAFKLFDDLHFGYRPPKFTRSFISELYLGESEVKRLLGQAMHVFLLNIPKLKFVAITPKSHYATFIILGDEIDQEMIDRVFATPQVRSCLPPGWVIPVQTCKCQPRINTGPPANIFTDRVVLVGDCGVSRLYKDGIGAAYRLSKVLAVTAISHGIGAEDFRRHYWPACQEMARDNALGMALFTMDEQIKSWDFMRAGMLVAIRREQAGLSPPRLSSALWDTFTGSGSYVGILQRMVHPSVWVRVALESMRYLLAK
ncbi:MAG: hypothetical protein HQM02_11570 [Magnetococcales bacterium]|nr:hypothetical protein [Magnetococcales bacterium]